MVMMSMTTMAMIMVVLVVMGNRDFGVYDCVEKDSGGGVSNEGGCGDGGGDEGPVRAACRGLLRQVRDHTHTSSDCVSRVVDEENVSDGGGGGGGGSCDGDDDDDGMTMTTMTTTMMMVTTTTTMMMMMIIIIIMITLLLMLCE